MGRMTLLGTGAAVAPGFTPLAISNLQAWYKADAGVTLNGSTVSQWNDQSGNLRHLTQSTATYQPLFVAVGQNAKPTVRFDAVDDFMQTAAVLIGLDNLTFFIVLNRQSDLNSTILGSGIYNAMYWQYYTTSYMGAMQIATNPLISTYQLRAGTATPTDQNMYKNSALIKNGNNVVASGYHYNEFRNLAYSSYPLNGDIAEVLIYSKVLNGTELLDVNTYLNDKYAIY